MNRKTLAICLLALAAVAGNAFAIAEARLTGKITDAVTKKPVPNVKISVSATERRTFNDSYTAKDDGTYALMLVDGTIRYKFVYSAPGYVPYEEVLKLKIGERNEKNVELQPGNAASLPLQAAPPSTRTWSPTTRAPSSSMKAKWPRPSSSSRKSSRRSRR